MKLKVFILSAWLAVAGTSAWAADSPAVKTGSAKADILVKSQASWNNKPYTQYPAGRPELTVLKLTIPPNTALPWHQHPYPNAGYVLKGELTIQDKDSGQSHTFKQGEGFAESVDDTHRGVSGNSETVLIITYSGVHDVPTFVSKQSNVPEY